MQTSRKLRIPYWYLIAGPALLRGIGFTMNAIVIAFNHGQMPVQWPGSCDADTMGNDIIHSCMTHATHFKFLADWVLINGVGIASPGDFLLWTYELTVIPALCAWVALMIKDSGSKKQIVRK